MKKRSIALLIACLMLMTLFAACAQQTDPNPTDNSGGNSGGGSTPASTESGSEGGSEGTEPEETEEPAPARPVRDLGGITVNIANWWADSDDLYTKENKTAYEEATMDYRLEIQEENNVTIRNFVMGGWGEVQEKCAVAIMSETPEASIYTLDSGWVYAILTRKLMYDVATLDSYKEALARDTTGKWNMLVADQMTFGGSTFGFATGYEPRTGIFFNKRLLENAGIDPEEPYNLQANGGWTWDAFEEMCKKTTRDTDQDGVIDTYALATFSADYTAAIVFSNDAQFVGKNDDGSIYNAIYEPNFLEAIQFARKLGDLGYVKETPEGANWDWFIAAFYEGQAAFRVCEEYNKDGMSKNMIDDYGFVTFPTGPNGSGGQLYRENVLFIPYCYTKEEAEAFMFAYDLWTDPIPGYEDAEDWKISAYPFFRDDRAVDETLDIMRKGENGVLRMEGLAGFTNDEFGSFVWSIWDNEWTPAELIEKVRVSWDTKIEESNVKLAALLD